MLLFYTLLSLFLITAPAFSADLFLEIFLKALSDTTSEKVLVSYEPGGPVVNTTKGLVRGVNDVSPRDKTPFYAFMGIPFAKPPVGELRFRDPIPIDPWQDIINATSIAPDCASMLSPGKGSEDCLYLNVYTPYLPKEGGTPKPVLVVIHGGGFIGGSADRDVHGPDFYMDHDIIFVTMSYRVGVLGFLSLQNDDVPGNAGLKDQRLAIQWVQENIEYFGGDKNRVTIAGQSAGAGSVGFHLLSESTAGLYHGAIMQSASALTPWAFTWPDEAEKKAFELGLLVGCVAADIQKNKSLLLNCLQEREADVIVTRQAVALTAEEIRTIRPFAFIPTLEPAISGAFLTVSPAEKLSKGSFNKVPLIIGANSNEGLMLLDAMRQHDQQEKITELFTADMTRWVPYTLNVTKDSPYAEDISQRIRKFYFKNEIPSHEEAIYMITIQQFILQIQEFAKLYSENSGKPVFNYYFTYDGPYALNKPYKNISDAFGVAHGDELGYLSNPEKIASAYGNHTDRSSIPELTIDRMTSMWTNFVKTGNPTPELDDVVTLNWPTFSGIDYNYLQIDEELMVKNVMLREHINFWNDIYEMVNGLRPLPE